MNAPTVAAIVMTHDRLDDARANIEIIRSCWTAPGAFCNVVVAHAYNGAADVDPVGREADLTVRAPSDRGHFVGAADLIDAGLSAVARRHPALTYAVCLASDTWVYRPDSLAKIVAEMAERGQRLAAAEWQIDPAVHGVARNRGAGLLPGSGLSTDYLVVDIHWAYQYGLLPLNFGSFLAAHADILNYLQEIPLLERHLEGKLLGAARREMAELGIRKDAWGSAGPRRARQLLRLIHERRIDPLGVDAPLHKGHWPELGLISSEDAPAKQALLRAHPALRGPTLNRLRDAVDTSWFNATDQDTPYGQPTYER